MGDQPEKYPGEFKSKVNSFYDYAYMHNCADCPLLPFCNVVKDFEENKWGAICDYLKQYFVDARMPKDQKRLF